MSPGMRSESMSVSTRADASDGTVSCDISWGVRRSTHVDTAATPREAWRGRELVQPQQIRQQDRTAQRGLGRASTARARVTEGQRRDTGHGGGRRQAGRGRVSAGLGRVQRHRVAAGGDAGALRGQTIAPEPRRGLDASAVRRIARPARSASGVMVARVTSQCTCQQAEPVGVLVADSQQKRERHKRSRRRSSSVDRRQRS